MTPNPADDAPGDHIRQAAAAALADVDALGVDGEDRKILLRALLQVRLPSSPAQTQVPQGAGPSAGNGQQGAAAAVAPIADGNPIAKICALLGVDRDLVDLVYAVQDGEPHVVISAKKIAQNKAKGARQLGQLVAAARQATGLEEWTSVGVIRKVVADYGRLDGANFAAHIQQMDSVALIRGKGQQREVKITKPGLEATAELIKTLAGTEG